MATIEAVHLSVSATGALPTGVPFLRLKEKILGKAYQLSIAFVSPAIAARLNRERRGKTYTPNTLAFPLTNTSGEIILCRSAIRAEYKKFGMDHRTYLTFLIIHSMLHLKGYQHGGTMEREEQRLLKLFSAQDGKTTHNRRN